MYIKNHDIWNFSKKELDKKQSSQRYRKGEIRWAALGVNLGSEIDGKGKEFLRPVLILEKTSPDLYFVIPMSTKIRDILGYRVFDLKDKKVSICLHQAKTISEKRIFSRIEKVNENKLLEIKEQFKKYLNL